ncbi:MAG: hypothetical protein RLY21_1059 [Planctomycetota bacterium]|jgi:hypothetical protein
MRVFWSIIALLAAIGVWFVLSGQPNPTQRLAPVADDPAGSPAAPDPAPKPPSAAEPAPAPNADPLGQALSQALFAPEAAAGGGATTHAPVARDTRSPAEITRRVDARTIELDGRYRVIGNGSPDDPYRISWELLTSAGPFIDPAQAALTPPPWVRALEGSYIEISAYYSTALRVPTTKHVLLTLNRWDGCCIGLPPTPFDAIDANLASSLDMNGKHLFRFGTFRGRLIVEPFAAGTYLLGLYRLEDAAFVTQ